MKKSLITIVVIVAVFVGAIYWSRSLQSQDTDLIARTGIHWHPTLEIFVNDEKVDIPGELGLVGVHSPIHTHSEDVGQGVIHLEFDRLVKREDVKLKNFFSVWGRSIESFGENVVMTVNGELSDELGEYMMRDGDKIELRITK